MSREISIKLLSLSDISKVMQLQKEVYFAIEPETERVMQRKIELSPSGCLGAWCNGELAGYILSHPWNSSKACPQLGEYLECLPKVPNSWYIHDLAISSKFRGYGVGKILVNSVFEIAKENGFSTIQLVAIQGSSSFWVRFGFHVEDKSSKTLSSYGEGAAFMSTARKA